jgi:hypothetical protein
MSRAAEKEIAAIASHITQRAGSCPLAVFLQARKKHITDHLNILPNWCQNIKYRKNIYKTAFMERRMAL